MIARNLETRIVKLEGSRRRADEIFVIWREAGGEVASAIAAADLAVGDEAICAEWFGDSPPRRLVGIAARVSIWTQSHTNASTSQSSGL
jgi:hypothetical protein